MRVDEIRAYMRSGDVMCLYLNKCENSWQSDFSWKLVHACKRQVPDDFSMDKVEICIISPFLGLGGLEVEMNGALFKFPSLFRYWFWPYFGLFSCSSPPEGWAWSGLFLRPCVRASVPLLGEAQDLWFRIILSEISENHLCILLYLAPVALKTHHKISTFFVKCLKHTIKWDVEIVNFITYRLQS